jgi:hypothetical protein
LPFSSFPLVSLDLQPVCLPYFSPDEKFRRLIGELLLPDKPCRNVEPSTTLEQLVPQESGLRERQRGN